MRSVILYIAMSLDGYIADREGGVDWLAGQEPGQDMPDSYSTLLERIDTVLLGWNTYHQLTTQLSPEQWPYEGLDCYVFTHRSLPSKEGITFADADPCALVRELKTRPGRDIWLCGGAVLAQALAAAGLIDRYEITVIPTLLGGGVPLFGTLVQEQKLRLLGTNTFNGMAELIYVPSSQNLRLSRRLE